jgi:hypothetical protein
MKKIALFAVLLVGILFLHSCAPTLGPVYQKMDTIPENQGLVVIYRPGGFVGAAVSYDIRVGETPIFTLYNGGYYPYFSKPGEVEFWAKTESRSAVTLDIKAGQTYYIRGTVGIGFLIGRPHLMVVPEDVAEKEISKCKLCPEKTEQ